MTPPEILQLKRGLLDMCKRDCEHMQIVVDRIVDGGMRTGENRGQGWIDTTSKTLEWNRSKIAEVNELMIGLEAELAKGTYASTRR